MVISTISSNCLQTVGHWHTAYRIPDMEQCHMQKSYTLPDSKSHLSRSSIPLHVFYTGKIGPIISISLVFLNRGLTSMGSSLLWISFMNCRGVGGPSTSTLTANDVLQLAHSYHGNTWVWSRAGGMQDCPQHSGKDTSLPPPDLLQLVTSAALLESNDRALM